MGLEVATFISQLVPTNPVGASDPKSQGDDHLRLIKATLLATFPAITAAVTSTHTELNALHGTQWLNPNNGTAPLPAFSYASDPDTGVYRIGANDLGISVGGALVGEFFSGAFRTVDGTVAAPGIGFLADTNTGIFRVGADIASLTAGGIDICEWRSVGVQGLVLQAGSTLYNQPGTLGAPSYSFASDQDTGISQAQGSDSLSVSCGGTERLRSMVGFNLLWGQIQAVDDGTVGVPAFSFNNDVNSGIYRVASDDVGISAGGVLVAQFRNVAGAVKILGADGTVTNPFYSFDLDTDTGMFRQGTDAIVIAAGGLLGFGAATAAGVVTCTIGQSNTARHALVTLTAAGATAGGGAALPATVAGFVDITINGTTRKIPFYAN